MHLDPVHLQSKKGLLLSAAVKFGAGLAMLGLVLFLCAGDIRYWNAWVYLIALAIPMLLTGIYLYRKDPELLRKRLNRKEADHRQTALIRASGLVFLAAFVLPGLDYRFGWSRMPPAVSVAATVLMLVGYGLFALTTAQNSYASRTVEIQQNQKVIDTGVYAVVRHPMYLASILLFLASPIVLGSWYAAIPMLVYPVVIVLRIRSEERLLMDELAGYADYARKVRYRLIPYIW